MITYLIELVYHFVAIAVTKSATDEEEKMAQNTTPRDRQGKGQAISFTSTLTPSVMSKLFYLVTGGTLPFERDHEYLQAKMSECSGEASSDKKKKPPLRTILETPPPTLKKCSDAEDTTSDESSSNEESISRIDENGSTTNEAQLRLGGGVRPELTLPESESLQGVQSKTDSGVTDSDDLCGMFVRLGLEDPESAGHLSYEDQAAEEVGARLIDRHLVLAEEGGHAHGLIACWRRPGTLDSDVEGCEDGEFPDEVYRILTNCDGHGDEAKTLKDWAKNFPLVKNGSRLVRSRIVKSLPPAGDKLLLAYTRDKVCSLGGSVKGPWYGFKSFASSPLWGEDDTQINAADVIQGDIDNCSAVAGIMLVVEHYPSCLRERIKRFDEKDDDGNVVRSLFRVQHWSERRGGCNGTSPEARKGPLETVVNAVFYVHRRANRKGGPGSPVYCSSRSGALLPMVLEKVYQKYRSSARSSDGIGSYEDTANENSMEAEAIMHFYTGLKFVQKMLREDGSSRVARRTPVSQKEQGKTWRLICSALHDGRAVSTGTYAKGSGRGEIREDDWGNEFIVANHNYGLLDAGEEEGCGRFVVLRNPHGKQLSPFQKRTVPAWPQGAEETKDGPELEKDGVFRITLSEFFNHFKTISCAAESCERYPRKRCHRYRPYFYGNDENLIDWCYEEREENGEENDYGSAIRRIDFDGEI